MTWEPIVSFDEVEAEGQYPLEFMSDEAAEMPLAYLSRREFADELTARYAHRQLAIASSGTTDAPLETPEDVFGERGFLLGKLAHQFTVAGKPARDQKVPALTGVGMGGVMLNVVSAGLRAVPFLITTEVWEVCRHMEIPNHVLSKDFLPFPLVWLTFDVSGGTVSPEDRSSIDAIVFHHTRDGFNIYSLVAVETEDAVRVEFAGCRYGKMWDSESNPGLAPFLAFFSMINSPHIGMSEARLGRAVRRRRIKENPQVQPGADRVYMLKLQPPGLVVQRGEASGQRDWKHRWAVRGHVRAQWYAKAKEHKLIWVAPYVKGPGDKPFKAKVYAK